MSKSTARDMTTGPILRHLVAFALPLMAGNIFQLLYNTVDTWVVGNYVSTQALAAVGSTTMVINIMVFFFNGLSIGAGVVISRYFGAHNMEGLHEAIETTMALTFSVSAVFTVFGVAMVPYMIRFMSTPADVIPEATIYLRIYFAGIAGLLIYNMGSGILRAVGDTTRPLYFLVLTSLLNIVLDLFFVLALHMGIAGVAIATIISQFISAVMVVFLLTRTKDIYRMTWTDLRINLPILKDILGIGLPTAIQSTVTSFSNVFVQSYINHFGSAAMAGYSCYNKLDSYVFLPMHSLSNAITTFVSQNVGARNDRRADRGAFAGVALVVGITGSISVAIIIFAAPAVGIFSSDPEVIRFGARFIQLATPFIVANCINQSFAGALRGRGISKVPMIIMLSCFVALRQAYLFLATNYIANTIEIVGRAYPVGWVSAGIIETLYYLNYRRKHIAEWKDSEE